MICAFHRAVTFGVLLLAAVAFISWKLNRNFNWNWFTVLLPLWIIDGLSALAIILKWRRSHNSVLSHRPSDTTHPLLILLGWFVFKCLVCLNLEMLYGISSFIVFFPLWCSLSLAIYTSFDILKKFAFSSFG